MNRPLFALSAIAVSALTGCPPKDKTPEPMAVVVAPPMDYPTARRGETTDTYHEVVVADPYRWLEDPDSDETRTWIDAENTLTRSWIDDVAGRDALKSRLEELWSYARFGTPDVVEGRFFYSHNNGLQDQSVLMVSDGTGDGRAIIDPNTFSNDATASMSAWSPSPDGSKICYATSESGSDWKTWRVRNVDTGEDLEDRVEWSKFSGCSWTADSKSFYYGRFPEPDDAASGTLEYKKLYLHTLGTPQDKDTLIAGSDDKPKWSFYGNTTADGELLIVTVREGKGRTNRLWIQDLTDAKSELVKVQDEADFLYQVIGHIGRDLYIVTTWDAPTTRVMKIDLDTPQRESWVEVIAATEDPIRDVVIAGEHLVVTRMHNAHGMLSVHGLDGTPETDVKLPEIGGVGHLQAADGSTDVHFSFSSYTTPSAVYRLDANTGDIALWNKPEVAFDPEAFETRQVWFTSKDGTRVPMFVVSKVGVSLDGDNPTELYGYGGFNIALQPRFKVENIVFMESGGVMAVANLRGGGEFGDAWHKQGTQLLKQNVFDDFIAGAQWLIDEGYATPKSLAIRGGSNGGLLVGATVIQRPELFGAAVPQVGVMDMLRYHRFTIGYAWADDYGTVDDSKEMFDALYAYSPVHNAKPANYPPIMVTTADHDDRVVPGHSFKFAAAMQHAQQGPAPVLIRIQTRAGHGAGKPTSMRIDEVVDRFSFYSRTIGMDWTATAVIEEPDPASQ